MTSRHGGFQSFARIGGPEHGAERLALLRAELDRRGLQGFLVPRADEHQNEYVPPSAERLLWLTGFSGSAGSAVVLSDKAAVFIDGRYVEQAAAQLDSKAYAALNIADVTPTKWLEDNAPKSARIGFDPWLHTPGSAKHFAEAAKKAGAELVAVDDNPIDAIWTERPAPPLGQIVKRAKSLAGENVASKLSRVRKTFDGADGLFISDAHDLAWLFNIRGSDVSHTPLSLGFAYVPAQGKSTIWIDDRKRNRRVDTHLSDAVEFSRPEDMLDRLAEQGAKKSRVLFDSASAPVKLTRALEVAGGIAVVQPSPITRMKARKNGAELAGMRAAHLRDGAALTRFLAWFDAKAPSGELTEISAALALEGFRRDTGALKEISFPTISAAGPHAAMPHYRVDETTDLPISKGLFLIDSGAQYEDGTTDVTRTIAVGRVSAEMRDRYTRVLKGMIAIASAVFPEGTTGAHIDAFARAPLWEAGLDFDHGTGHGVGAYLSVHEGPQRISKAGHIALEEGMILSDEPGYYAPGRYGIRIENLVVVEARAIKGAERKMLGFETITSAPIDVRPIEVKLMTPYEIFWLDSYHARVRKALSPLVDAPTRRWLREATKALGATLS